MCLQIVLCEFAPKKDTVIYFNNKKWILPFWVGERGGDGRTEAFIFNSITPLSDAVYGLVPCSSTKFW